LTKLYEENRPKTKEEIIGQDAAVEKLFSLLDNGLVRDFLLSGPSGCGKTTAARVAAMYLWPDAWEERYHEFNASDDRGINFIRNEIKELAQFSYPKVIVLDEADSMTEDAYEALRKPLEGSTSSYFILCVNNDTKVLPAIKSRCSLIKFRPLDSEDVWTVMMNVLDNQEVEYDLEDERVKQMFEHIAVIANGDLRIAIQELAAYIKVEGNEWSLNLDRPLENAPNVTYLEKAIEMAVSGNLKGAIQHVEDALIVDRIIPDRAVKQAYDYIMQLQDDTAKAEILHRLAELDVALQTSYPLIQYAGFLSYVWLVGSMTQKVAA
jgi:DNA polymerase III delta prime subunit